MTALPQRWEKIRLSELRPGRNESVDPSKTPDGVFEVYSVPAFPTGKYELLRGMEIGSSKQRVERGTVLLCGINPRINRVWVVSASQGNPQIASTEWIAFRPVPELISEYLAYFLQQNTVRDYLARNASGVGGSLMRVKGHTCAQIELPLAPCREQRRIVEEIEKHFTRLDAAIAALNRVQANLKRYRAAILKAACEGRLVPTEAELARREGRSYEPASNFLERVLIERRTRWEAAQISRFQAASKTPKDNSWKLNYEPAVAPEKVQTNTLPEGWTWATIEQLTALESNSITDGPFGSNLKTEHYTAEGPRVIRLQNIGDSVFLDARAHISADHYKKLAKHKVQAGDIVIAALGKNPPRSCIIPPTVGEAIVKADCIRFKPAPEAAISTFLNLVLNAEPTKARMADVVHGVGRPRLNLGEIKAIVVPLPPINEQRRIVSEAERRLSIIDELQMQTGADQKRSARLRQSILKRAFEGKLVSQDETDESATGLLERIRSDGKTKPDGAKPNMQEGQMTVQ